MKLAQELILIFTLFGLGTSVKYVDLSHGYTNNMPVFPGHTPFRWTRHIDKELYRMNDFETTEHCGTHIDAPLHVVKDTDPIDKLPVDVFIVPAILINASAEAGDNRNYTLPKEKILQWEKENGPIPDGCAVLVEFGWHRFWPNAELFLNAPGVSKEAAEYLVETKKVHGLGVDTVSADQGMNIIAHQVLLKSGIYIIENLNFPSPLPPKFNVIALPLRLIGGTGSPSRVVAYF